MPCPGYSGGTVPVDTVHQKGLSGKAGGALTAREPTKKLLSEKLVERCPAGATLRSHILKSWWSTPCALDQVIGFWLTNHTGNPAGIIDLRINGHGDTIYGIGRKTEPRYSWDLTCRPRDRRFQPQDRQPATAFGTRKEEIYGPSICAEYKGPAHSNSDRCNNDRDDLSGGMDDYR